MKLTHSEGHDWAEVDRMLANLPGMMYRCHNCSEWDMVYFSKGCEALTGYKPEQLLMGTPSYNAMICPDDRQKAWDIILKAINKKEPYDITYRLVDSVGEVKWVWERGLGVFRANGELAYLEGFITDVTTKVGGEQALAASEQRYRGLFESMVQGVYCQTAEGAIIDINQAALDMLDLTREQALGCDPYHQEWKIMDENGRILQPEEFFSVQALKKGKAIKNRRVWVYNPRLKKYRMLRLNATPQYLPGENKPYQIVVILEDLTALQAAEDYNQSLLSVIDRSPDFIGVADKNQVSIFINPAGRSLVGLEDNEDIRNITITDFFLHDDIPFVRDTILPQLEKTGRWSGEFRFRHFKSGGPIEVSFDLFRSYDPKTGETQNYYSITRDISKNKQIEQILQEQMEEYEVLNEDLRKTNMELLLEKTKVEERETEMRKQNVLMKTLLDNLTQGVFMVEAPTGKPILANKAALNILGQGIMSDTDAGNLSEVYKAIKAGTGMPYPIVEWPIVLGMQGVPKRVDDMVVEHPDGKLIHLEVIGTPVRDSKGSIWASLVSFSDITERVNTRNALLKAKEVAEASQRKFKAIADTSPLAIFISKGKEQVAEYINPAFISLFGYSPEDVPTVAAWWPLAYPVREYRKHIANEWNRRAELAILARTAIEPMETLVTCKDGTIRNILWGFFSTGDENWAFGLDLTAYRNAEQELVTALDKAHESDRLKTAFLQNMSHEIRTPMNAICGFADLLNSPGLSEEKRKSFSSIVVNSSNQLLGIVNDILAISALETRQEKLLEESVALHDLLSELFSVFKQQAKTRGISMVLNQGLPLQKLVILTDRVKITQVLTNLIANALKFTRKGMVEFGYKQAEEGGKSFLTFYVNDTGIGINKESKDKIFDRFRQADEEIRALYGGTGLGLAISKGFVELMGGRIWVESEPGVGSQFFFTLPCKMAVETKEQFLSGQTPTGVTILVAEDEENNFLFIKEILASPRITLLRATNGKESLELCRTNAGISLVLMDIKMPVMDGYTAATQIKKLFPGLPIIAQSAYALEHEIAKYKNIFDDYLVKPLRREQLLSVISKFVTTVKNQEVSGQVK